MLAMVVQTPRGVRQPVSSLTTIASMLAPTGVRARDQACCLRYSPGATPKRVLNAVEK